MLDYHVSESWERQPGEDDLAWLHRLADLGYSAWRISHIVGLDIHNVSYVMRRNDYNLAGSYRRKSSI